ncbi:uncharacterized protein BXIN_2514 [Babesia sp. Xinjiang]|uniref:uncharacterized protein n=1 Tax=Babesia sp. Xinjiang TaxID=462227 RepID=UPI000A221559|nr:uncharacterized protein BXIN_2514 [Babesia sp. Xinjiang]ORM41480.1 hypothetical protein BXIN_2514 [Babesia sp. Xinjiang]
MASSPPSSDTDFEESQLSSQCSKSDVMYSVLETAAARIRNCDFVDAISILDTLEQESIATGSLDFLARCSELQAEIQIYIGNYKEGLRYLLRCNAGGATAMLAARITLGSPCKLAAAEIASSLATLLSECISRCTETGSQGSIDAPVMLLELLSRSGKLSSIQKWLTFIYSQGLSDSNLRSAPTLAPCLRMISTIHHDWLHDNVDVRAISMPLVPFGPPDSVDTDDNVELVHNLSTAVNDTVFRKGQFVYYVPFIWKSILGLVKELQKVECCENENGLDYVNVSVVEHSVSAYRDVIRNNRASPNKRRGISFGTTSRGILWRSTDRWLKTRHLSLERLPSFDRNYLTSIYMEQRVSRILAERLRVRLSWTIRDLALLFFDVLSRYYHLLDRNREQLTLYLCILLTFICDDYRSEVYSGSLSSGVFYTTPSKSDLRLIHSSDTTLSRLREVLARSGIQCICLILSTLRRPSGGLRQCAKQVGIDDPYGFMHHTFARLSSLMLFYFATKRQETLQLVVMRARLLFAFAKDTIREHFPRRGLLIRGRSRDAYIHVRSITTCLRALHRKACTLVLRQMSRNAHLMLSIRHRESNVNFHNSTTHGTFDLGVAAIERRWLNLTLILRRYKLKM